MKRAAFLAGVVLGVAGLVAATAARAQDGPYGTGVSNDAPSSPAPPAPAPPAPAPPADSGPSHGALARVSAVGAYRRYYDVDFLGVGAALSIGGDYPTSGGFELRVFGGRSFGGLTFADVAALGTITGHLDGGFFLAAGAGLEVFSIVRATNGDTAGGGGPAGLLRLGYDFARGSGVFMNADVSFFYGGTTVWGPTVAVGYRF